MWEDILVHRRHMFEDMGHRDATVLDGIVRSSRPVLKDFLRDGSYVGWFAVTHDGQIAAGVGLLISPSLSGPLAPEFAERCTSGTYTPILNSANEALPAF